MFYAVLRSDGQLTYCNAGHNPPVVVGSSGVRRLERGGFPAGLFEGLPYEEGTLMLDPGDQVVVFSDGVSEALNVGQEEFGEERIIAVASRLVQHDASDILNELVSSVRGFAAGAPQHDDVTALVVRYRGASSAAEG
jgi:sigma-B regulation protein RsbU (phosphoserine phosphatase)